MGLVTKVFVGNEREMYHRMAEWYKSPECEGLRVAWGPYPATQGALQSWPGFVAVTNAFLDSDAADDRLAVATAAGEPAAAEAEESVATGSAAAATAGRSSAASLSRNAFVTATKPGQACSAPGVAG